MFDVHNFIFFIPANNYVKYLINVVYWAKTCNTEHFYSKCALLSVNNIKYIDNK
jgi:hypothetical protein